MAYVYRDGKLYTEEELKQMDNAFAESIANTPIQSGQFSESLIAPTELSISATPQQISSLEKDNAPKNKDKKSLGSDALEVLAGLGKSISKGYKAPTMPTLNKIDVPEISSTPSLELRKAVLAKLAKRR